MPPNGSVLKSIFSGGRGRRNSNEYYDQYSSEDSAYNSEEPQYDDNSEVVEFEVRPVGAEEQEGNGRLDIVGGVAVKRGNVPWQVNLGGVGVMCGGTIVAMDVSF